MNDPSIEFGQQIRSLREAQGLSVRALADRLGVSKVTVWKWEKGNSKPSARMTAPLAKALNIAPAQLRFHDAVVIRAESQSESVGQGNLVDVVARAKQMIAEASGVAAQNVTITIEY